MKEIFMVNGGALFGIGALCLLSSAQGQNATNPIVVFEVYRPVAFYCLFGILSLFGLVSFIFGVVRNQNANSNKK